jgi:isochorismate synthase/2-succinyl-5-enolpyruvyl-6-hydroxy-3-cyclohexene-1-carboxylate synthase/2-succinyl-6-hydroxy-2,4-cyclohexadiene-1-carboxylate synthase/O-succinylbenzoate synthase
MQQLRDIEPFDRGFYAGPFGWISGTSAEFAVAIRSMLVQPQGNCTIDSSNGNGVSSNGSASTSPTSSASTSEEPCHRVHFYAGVGVVRGSDPASEWAELTLKARQYESLLQPAVPVAAAPNINLASAMLLVEELCRLGVNTFCVAPGGQGHAAWCAG